MKCEGIKDMPVKREGWVRRGCVETARATAHPAEMQKSEEKNELEKRQPLQKSKDRNEREILDD